MRSALYKKANTGGRGIRLLIAVTGISVIAFFAFSQAPLAQQMRQGVQEALSYNMNLGDGAEKIGELLGIGTGEGGMISVSGKPAGMYAKPTDGEIRPYSQEDQTLTALCGRFYNVFSIYAGEIKQIKRTGELWEITVLQQDGCLAIYGGCGLPLVNERAKLRTGQPIAMAPDSGSITLSLVCGKEKLDPSEYFA